MTAFCPDSDAAVVGGIWVSLPLLLVVLFVAVPCPVVGRLVPYLGRPVRELLLVVVADWRPLFPIPRPSLPATPAWAGAPYIRLM